MSQISPYHPEIDAIWHAISNTGARSIAIVSADPGEGTAMIAAALACRAALSVPVEDQNFPADKSVPLLVDLDVVRPSLARTFKVDPRENEIVPLETKGIALLGAIGSDAINTWRERARLTEQLAVWHARWNLVVLNAAPLLTMERRRGKRGSASDRQPQANRATDIPGLVAASVADACVLVALAGRTPGNRIREACETLSTAGANLIGCILNDRENPSLLAELDRETYRFDKVLPRAMASLRSRLHRSPILGARI